MPCDMIRFITLSNKSADRLVQSNLFRGNLWYKKRNEHGLETTFNFQESSIFTTHSLRHNILNLLPFSVPRGCGRSPQRGRGAKKTRDHGCVGGHGCCVTGWEGPAGGAAAPLVRRQRDLAENVRPPGVVPGSGAGTRRRVRPVAGEAARPRAGGR